jgi:transcriptional regulator with XRE-family HTH domain
MPRNTHSGNPAPEFAQLFEQLKSAIPTFVKEARTKMGLTQQELGERVGVTQMAIGGWEKGRFTPDFPMMAALSLISGHPLPHATRPVVDPTGSHFGAEVLLLVSTVLERAANTLPTPLVRSMQAPATNLAQAAEFLLALEKLMEAKKNPS